MIRNQTITEIIACDTCRGNGYIECSELVDYHKGDYDCWNEICYSCNGSGRIVKTTTIEYKKFDNSIVENLLKEKIIEKLKDK